MKKIYLIIKGVFTNAYAIICVIATALAFFVLFPRVSIVPDKALNIESPLQTIFLISNDGSAPIRSLEYQAIIRRLQSVDGGIDIRGGNNITIMRTANTIPQLGPNKKTSIISPVPITFGHREIARAEIEFRIKYRTFAWPFWMKNSWYYVALKDSQGQWQWVPKDISEIE